MVAVLRFTAALWGLCLAHFRAPLGTFHCDWHPRVMQPDSSIDSERAEAGGGGAVRNAGLSGSSPGKRSGHTGGRGWGRVRERLIHWREVLSPMTIPFCERGARLSARPVVPEENLARSACRTHSLTPRTMQNENLGPCVRKDEGFRNSDARALDKHRAFVSRGPGAHAQEACPASVPASLLSSTPHPSSSPAPLLGWPQSRSRWEKMAWIHRGWSTGEKS